VSANSNNGKYVKSPLSSSSGQLPQLLAYPRQHCGCHTISGLPVELEVFLHVECKLHRSCVRNHGHWDLGTNVLESFSVCYVCLA
jgi:hypothetical protein